jgi:parallel beta-helix repeat protein
LRGLIIIFSLHFISLLAHGIEVSGEVYGTWTAANNPYNVVGELIVPPDYALIILPGVEVIFQGNYKFKVLENAVLRAVGAEQDSILFRAVNQDTGWHGIRFLSASDSCKMKYCLLTEAISRGEGEESKGGAVYCSNTNMTFSHSRFYLNDVDDDNPYYPSMGGGIYFTYSDAIISDCRIDYNKAKKGGGVYCHYSNPTIENCIILGNDANGNSSAYIGGGIYCDNSDPLIINNIIEYNEASREGSGISCFSSNPTVENNEIRLNYSDMGYGGAIYCSNSDPIILNNIIAENDDMGIQCDDSHPMISENTIENNTNKGIYCSFGSNPEIDGNSIIGNVGGISCVSSSPNILNNYIHQNYRLAFTSGGGIKLSGSTSLIENNIITENQGSEDGGGISCQNSNPLINNNIITGNTSVGGLFVPKGAGINCESCSCVVISNNVISENELTGNGTNSYGAGICISSYQSLCSVYLNSNLIVNNVAVSFGVYEPVGIGGGIMCGANTELYIQNNTISGNQADRGGGIYINGSTISLLNCIVWGNSPSDVTPEYYLHLEATYCDIGGEWPGIGNIDADPMFVNPDSGDYNLQWGSPCIDAGDPNSPLDPDSTRADMGALYYNQNPSFIADEEHGQPLDFNLQSPYPNPFNSQTTISYSLPKYSYVELSIFNLAGRQVTKIADGWRDAGVHEVTFDGSYLSSGVYIFKLKAGDFEASGKMVLLK